MLRAKALKEASFSYCRPSRTTVRKAGSEPNYLTNLQLMTQADANVFVQNLAPGAAQRLGLDYETLSKKYPRLIVCDISDYGLNGLFRDKKA